MLALQSIRLAGVVRIALTKVASFRAFDHPGHPKPIGHHLKTLCLVLTAGSRGWSRRGLGEEGKVL